MNYITEMKAFYDLLETNPLPSPAIALWHALMHIANKTGWQPEFAVAVSVLEGKTGLGPKAIERARNQLAQAGLIVWKKRGGNQSANYRICSLCDKLPPDFVAQGVAQPVAQYVAQPVAQSVAINKHKRNETNKISYQGIADLYNETCVSFPRCLSLSEARRRAIRARLNSGRTLEDFRRLFELAEGSDFLKGRNKRSWTATFDWLIQDANMTKVLEGNYQNRTERLLQPLVEGDDLPL